jgi:hypothetical protein
MSSNVIHTYPANDLREHETNDLRGSCWCGPEVRQLCPICSGDEEGRVSCGYCEGSGLVPAFTDETSYPTLITHNAADGRE